MAQNRGYESGYFQQFVQTERQEPGDVILRGMHHQAEIRAGCHPNTGPYPGFYIGGYDSHDWGIWGQFGDLLEDSNPPIPAFVLGYRWPVEFAARRYDVSRLRFAHTVQPGTGPAAMSTESEKVRLHRECAAVYGVGGHPQGIATATGSTDPGHGFRLQVGYRFARYSPGILLRCHEFNITY